MLKASVTDRLSFLIISLFYLATMLIGYYFISNEADNRKINEKNQKMLVHLVLIQFKEEMGSFAIIRKVYSKIFKI